MHPVKKSPIKWPKVAYVVQKTGHWVMTQKNAYLIQLAITQRLVVVIAGVLRYIAGRRKFTYAKNYAEARAIIWRWSHEWGARDIGITRRRQCLKMKQSHCNLQL